MKPEHMLAQLDVLALHVQAKNTANALEIIFQIRLDVLTDIRLAAAIGQEPQLPKIRYPAGSKPPKRRASSITCPTCKARPGKPCMKMDKRGFGATPTDDPLTSSKGPYFHKERYDKARVMQAPMPAAPPLEEADVVHSTVE